MIMAHSVNGCDGFIVIKLLLLYNAKFVSPFERKLFHLQFSRP